jgi:hypothetical protein
MGQKERRMVLPRSSNRCLEIIENTAVGRLFSEIEQEIIALEQDAEEAKKKVWNLEFRICEMHRKLDETIDSIAESYLHKELPLKTRQGVWSVISNKRKA